MRITKILSALAAVTLVFNACNKNDDKIQNPPIATVAMGEYILSEGTTNNTKLSYYSNTTNKIIGDFFLQQNPSLTAGLGDIGNDMIIYGSKLYIIMNQSGLVTVLNASNAIFQKNIPFKIEGTNTTKGPRYAASAKGKVYVSSTDGTVSIIDTTSLTIIGSIDVGSNPEQLAVSGDKLFVTNSGGYNFPNYDSTVSVINLINNTAGIKIKVGLNPRKIVADDSGNLYVVVTGNYGSIPSKIVKINSVTESVTYSADTAVNTIAYFNNKLFVTNDFAYTGLSSNVRILSTSNFSNIGSSFVTDGTQIQTPYGLNIDEVSSDVYITDAKNFASSGEVFCFDKNGKKKFSFSVSPGVNPNKVLFLY
jgi:YVTN family beta-propeller protein